MIVLYYRKGRSMVRKTATQLGDSRFVLLDSDLAQQIGGALRQELGATRQSSKTIMRWTGVSDTTARSWLCGRVSPSGAHLVTLAANSSSVMTVFLTLTGHSDLEVGLDLRRIETGLEQALVTVRGAMLEPRNLREDKLH